ncbi:alpha-(1-_3)-arabinofuranosyltransferase domain-containing protein [Actinomadura parmotrematis]|uniref:Alpha-(1->3)-arabinofuranosyltransferase n=1 Tax=Actinomadura parmotrematis TaxID=2864039 RepID=A0ABS7G4B6_9ACTN|nr:alpha-(1->3)-arabinofuranosyltransferase family protein [Actinomadura parmotrematis]MBW8487565.1 alpha-(1->3)-arabinofuranosyltransferase [Actinomadura parmotrematis]
MSSPRTLPVPPRPAEPAGVDAALRDRLRRRAAALALVTLSFAIAPGRIIADTKLDMALNPGAFLGRALHMWDAGSSFGQVQNQAYGYLFPMGPFYLAGHAAHLPPWVTQRLWLALVMVAAFSGLVRLAAALDVGTPNGRLLAGFAYALAPKAQLLLGVNSSEFLPAALLPWMLLPLVRGARGDLAPRRAAGLSALAVVCCGGINATAEAAVLAVPLLYLLTRAGGKRKRRLLAWWLPLLAAATFWWVVPTYLMGKYIFPFLDYTESAATTTSTTSLLNALRGTSAWTAYLPVDTNPWWPAGNALATTPWLIAATALVAGFGLYGLARSGMPERAFLVLSLVLGAAIIVSGHPGALAAPFDGRLRGLLDGTLAPFRNVHKFDALIRLPLVLGLARLPVALPPRTIVPVAWWRRSWRTVAGLAAGTAVVLASVPMLDPGPASKANMPDAVPAYWRQATGWLNSRGGLNTSLAVPGVRTGDFTWGRAMDDPLQAMLSVSWANRMGVPYGSAGASRLMEAIDQRFATGRGSKGLTLVLARMGVRFVVVRNDLDRVELGGAWPARVHEALAASPGMTKVADFGGAVGSVGEADAAGSFDQAYNAVEIYEVAGAAAPATTVAAARPLRVLGGPEALLTLADEGLLDGDRPVVFGDDPAGAKIPAADTVSTDTLRRREVNYSDLRNGASPTMTAGQPYTGTSKVKDVTDPAWAPYRTVAKYSGVASVTASSSAADVAAPSNTDSKSRQPYSALDGDPDTQWVTSGWNGAVGEWIDIRFDRPLRLDRIQLTFSTADFLGPAVSEVRLEGSNGSVVRPVAAGSTAQALAGPAGTSDHLKITVTRTAGVDKIGSRVALTQVTVPGLLPSRTLVPPAGGSTTVFTGLDDWAQPCMRGPQKWTCNPQLQRRGDDGAAFDRTFTAASPSRRTLTGSAIITDLDRIASATSFGYPKVKASSAFVDHPALLARSAFDGDPATTWIAAPDDTRPALTAELAARALTVGKIKIAFPGGGRHRVEVTGDDGTRSGLTAADGTFTFTPLHTRNLRIAFPDAPGVQVTDVTVPGVKALGEPAPLALNTRCGTGPAFRLDGAEIRTRLVGGTVADLVQGRPVRYAACGQVPVAQGRRHLVVPATDAYRIATAVLAPAAAEAAAEVDGDAPDVSRWTPQRRTLQIGDVARASYLVLNENFNKGWEATAGGQALRAVRLDGWRQAWLLPAGTTGPVELVYAPDRPYRLVLVAGLVLVLLVAGITLPGRRAAPSASPLPPATPFARWGLLRWPLAAAAGFWIGGFAGLALVPAGLALGLHRRLGGWTALVLTAVAGGVQAFGSWLTLRGAAGASEPLTETVPLVLVLVALGLVLRMLSEPSASASPAPSPGPATPDAAARPDLTQPDIHLVWRPAPADPPPNGNGRPSPSRRPTRPPR